MKLALLATLLAAVVSTAAAAHRNTHGNFGRFSYLQATPPIRLSLRKSVSLRRPGPG